MWADPRGKQNTTYMSLDTANDESYNISKTPQMQNLSPLGLTNTTGEGHNAHSTLTGPCRFWQGTQRGYVLIPISRLSVYRIWDRISLVVLEVLISLINFFMKVK